MTLRVEGKEIAQEAVDYELQRLMQFYSQHMTQEQIAQEMDVLREKAKQQAVGTALLLREARHKNTPIPDSEVEQAFAGMTSNAGGEEAFRSMLEQQGLDEDAIRSSIRMGKQVDRLVSELTAGIPEPTEKEIREHYETHRDDYCSRERICAQHILVKPESDSEPDRQNVKQELIEIKQEFEAGSDFGDLAAAHSDCPSGQEAGGSLGWITRGSMVLEFEQALFSTETGKLSEIIETPLGYHIILSTDHEEPRPASFEESKETIRDLLSHSRKGKVISEYTDKLKTGVSIKDD